MHRRLIAIACLFLLLGSLGALRTLQKSVPYGGLNVDVLVFLLPVGIGLLRRKKSSRRWAAFWAVLMGALISGMLLYVQVFAGGLEVELLGYSATGTAAKAIGWLIPMLVVLASATVVRALYTAPVSAEFSSRHEDQESHTTSRESVPV